MDDDMALRICLAVIVFQGFILWRSSVRLQSLGFALERMVARMIEELGSGNNRPPR